jgi:tetratricopeptide (TPR) repeat protein
VTPRRRSLATGCLLLALVAAPAPAHEGVPEQIQAVTRQIQKDPKNGSLYLKRGELHRVMNAWAAAAGDYDRAAALDASLRDEVTLCRGRSLLDQCKPKEARPYFDRYLTKHPDAGDALVLRARALLKLGEGAKAADDYAKAVEKVAVVKPEHYLGWAESLAGSGRTTEAVAVLDQGIARLGPAVTMELSAVDLELRLSRVDAALARLEAIASRSPRKETWLARRATILEKASRTSEARAAYQEALAAIESLPQRHRGTQATEELLERVRAGLERTAAAN